MPPCPCRWCKAIRAIAVTAWSGLAVGLIVVLFSLSGCGTISDKHDDFPPEPHLWDVT